jgi:hypothetical protein
MQFGWDYNLDSVNYWTLIALALFTSHGLYSLSFLAWVEKNPHFK